jgi:adenylate cyclase
MSVRTYQQLLTALTEANNKNDIKALEQCARELESIGTDRALAASNSAHGTAYMLLGDHTKALDHYHRSLELQQTVRNPIGEAAVTGNIGIIHYNQGDHRTALDYFQRALKIYDQLNDKNGSAIFLGNIGNVLSGSARYAEALEHYDRAIALHEELDQHLPASNVITNYASVLISLDDHPGALARLHKAFDTQQTLGNLIFASSTLSQIGKVYLYTSDYPTAIEYFQRAYELQQELGYKRGIAQTSSLLGVTFGMIGDFTTDLEWHERALAIHVELGDQLGRATDLVNIGEAYQQLGDDTTAVTMFWEAITCFNEIGVSKEPTYAMSRLVRSLIRLRSLTEAAELLEKIEALPARSVREQIDRLEIRATFLSHEGSLDDAVMHLNTALNLAREHSLMDLQTNIHEALRDLHQKRNDFAGYIEHNAEFLRTTEEIRGKETTVKIAMGQKQREIDAREREHEKQLAVLHSTLPKHIADRVARGEQVNDHYDNAAVIFVDIVGFTTLSDQLSSNEVVQLLGSVFTSLDAVCKKYDVVKIKTIGDSYMAVAFPSTVPRFARNDSPLPSERREESVIPNEVRNDNTLPHSVRNDTAHLLRAASAALEMLTAIADLPESIPAGLREALPEGLQVRMGLHCGPLTAGVIGNERLQYDVWGDTVNVASRMESSGEPGRIHVSETFANALNSEMAKERNGETDVIPSDSEEPFPIPYSLFPRGEMEIKGKGMMTTYWMERAS